MVCGDTHLGGNNFGLWRHKPRGKPRGRCAITFTSLSLKSKNRCGLCRHKLRSKNYYFGLWRHKPWGKYSDIHQEVRRREVTCTSLVSAPDAEG